VLPEIGFMGRTQLRPKLVDLFHETTEKHSSQQSRKVSGGLDEYPFYNTRRIVFKPLKSKSQVDRTPLCTPDGTPNIRMKRSLPASRIEEVMVRRLHLNDKKVTT
jgi:hypothetical protein